MYFVLASYRVTYCMRRVSTKLAGLRLVDFEVAALPVLHIFFSNVLKMSRPVVSVFDIESADSVTGTVTLPAVFTAPIRADVVHYVHTLMAKNKRQAYAVNSDAGMQVN